MQAEGQNSSMVTIPVDQIEGKSSAPPKFSSIEGHYDGPPARPPARAAPVVDGECCVKCFAYTVSGGLLSILFAFIIGVLFCLSIVAIVIGNNYGDSDCITSYSGISFGYGKWLVVYGAVNIAVVSAIIIFFFFGLIDDCKDCMMSMVIFLAIMLSIFQFSFYIVGAVLFFKEVDNDTCKEFSSPLYQFGLAEFIIQTIIWGGACCGGGSKKE